MHTIALPPAPRRRRLALGGALFLAADALLMGVAIGWITRGEHLGLAAALAAAGVVVSLLLARALSRPPRATLSAEALRVEAAHRTFVLDHAALRGARIEEIDLATLPASALPKPLVSTSPWRTGDALGWQADGRGQALFCAVTRLGPALRIDAGDAGVLLWTPSDPAAARQAIADALAG
ncbi:hypothetical protein [Silanimonas algicola]